MSPVHTEQVNSYVPVDNGNSNVPEDQPEVELQPPRETEEDADGGEQTSMSDVARSSVSGQESASAEIVEPLEKRAHGRPWKTYA